MLSVVIPARNEEYNLRSCIESLRDSAERAGIDLEIVVVINRCTDKTEEVARSLGAQIIHEEAPNLSKIRNAGVRASKAEFIITLDADNIVSKNMISKVLNNLGDQNIVGGGVLILPERWSLGIVCTGLLLLPVALYHRITVGLFFFRRNDFEAIGGFNEELVSVEDIDFAVRLKRFGIKTRRKYKNLLTAYIATSMRKFDKLGDWYFVQNPKKLLGIFKGRDQELANKIWYDFER